MLNMIAGVYPVDSGSIIIDGTDVTKLPEFKRAKYLGRGNFNHLIMNWKECIVFATRCAIQVDILYTHFEAQNHSQLILKE